jgi:hypothetical protein
MKRIFIILAIYGSCMFGQNTNVQTNFQSQVSSNHPSTWLDFNDLTTSFKDTVSGANFGGGPITATPIAGTHCSYGIATGSSLPCTLTTTSHDALIVFVDSLLTATITSVTDSLGATAVLVGGSASNGYAYYFANVASGSHLITVTLNTAVSNAYPQMQVVDVINAAQSSPIDTYAYNVQSTSTTAVTSGPLTTTGAGEMLIGHALGGGAGGTYTAGSPVFTLFTGGFADSLSGTLLSGAAGAYTFNATSSVSLPWVTSLFAIKPFIATSGTALPRQPGFDSTQINNTSAGFPYNGFNIAPNNTIGDVEWSQPHTWLLHIDRLGWNRSGQLILASKGDIGSTSNPWWKITMTMAGTGGLYSYLCFTENGPNSTGAPFPSANQSVCSNGNTDYFGNGYNYDVVITQSGSGYNPGLTMYVNGTNAGLGASGSFTVGFGPVGVTVSGGTGYAASTAFTATGGGTYCVVNGSFASSGGVPTGSVSYTQTSGCTSTPTIVLTAPTGTGATVTPTLYTSTMSTSATEPLLVPGAISNSAVLGIDSTDSTQATTYIDEFVEFPTVLPVTPIVSIFYQTKFYQGLVFAPPANPALFIFDDDAGSDPDNQAALALTIAAHRNGYLKLAGVVNEDQSVTCEAMWRQMLDQAGLANIPQAVPNTFYSNTGTSACATASINQYNASTPKSNSAWQSSVTLYRTIFAANPTKPINIILGGAFTGYAEFLLSGADGISPLTGIQLQTQNATNGGAIYAQGLFCGPASYPATTPCSTSVVGDNSLIDPASGAEVVNNNGSMPIYWFGGSPQASGPDQFYTRQAQDPYWQFLNFIGSYSRVAFDSLPMSALLTKRFYLSMSIGYTGGTGYANSTAFNFSGGGAGCAGTGIMTASGGVPNGISYQWGVSAYATFAGVGYGCTSTPTINLVGATGTGVILTAYPTSVCGTYTINVSAATGATTSATCSNHYFQPYSIYATAGGSGPIFTWFLNSFLDPPPNGAPK